MKAATITLASWLGIADIGLKPCLDKSLVRLAFARFSSSRVLREAIMTAAYQRKARLCTARGGMTSMIGSLAAAQSRPKLKVAVAYPCDSSSLEAVFEAAELGLIEPILVGPQAKITGAAEALGKPVLTMRIVDAPHSYAAAEQAVGLVRAGEAEAVMKGSLHTDEFMAAVVRRESGLRTARRISHCFVMDVPGHETALIITDAAVNIAPTLEDKVHIVQNAIDLARAMGVDPVRVAILSATKLVNPKLPSTIEAAALCKMADRGQITGGILDGPLALDNAIDLGAAKVKKIQSLVAGQANVLVVPDLEAGNMLAKSLTFLAGADAAGIVLGARVPVILTSRADSTITRLASCAVASLVADSQRKQLSVPEVEPWRPCSSSSMRGHQVSSFRFSMSWTEWSLGRSGKAFMKVWVGSAHFLVRGSTGDVLDEMTWSPDHRLGTRRR